MKRMTKILGVFAALLLVVILLTACWRRAIPDTGVWYCAEIGTRIDFGSGYFLEVDGKEERGQIDSDRGSSYFMLWCEDQSSDCFGRMYYTFKCIRCDETEMTVRDYDTGAEYTFVRVE